LLGAKPLSKIIQTLVAWGPLGVLVVALLDATGVPMVGGVDALIVLIAVTRRSEAYWSAGTAILGSLIGSLILFFIARKGGEEYHRRHTSTPRSARLRAWFHEYGLLTVFVPAFVPIIPMPLKVFIISAGALEESAITFSIVLLAARIPRYLFLAWLGARLGRDTLPYLEHHIWQLAMFSLVLFVSLYFAVRVVHDNRVSKSKPRS
jgi:membrane protein YqaA with SNARE-associated domain